MSEAVELPGEGDVIAGKYKVVRMLGRGGMGAVYLAQHEILRQPVAVKLLLPEIAKDHEAVTRFLNEARAAARIRNEHVAQVMDVGDLPNGSAYLVLEYLEGKDLAVLVEEKGQLGITEAVDYTLQALEAVAEAHALGIVHRDLKPANLYLAKRRDGTPLVKVLDFGISKATNPMAEPGTTGVTNTKAILGSPGYMSPEQVKSSKKVDARSDLWSMGVILYRLLTDEPPFDGETLGEIFAAIIEGPPPPPREYRPEIPEALERVIMKCLERDREKRWSNCAELAAALVPFASEDGAQSADRVSRSLGVAPARRASLPEASAVAGAPPEASKDGGAPAPGTPTEPADRGAEAASPAVASAPAITAAQVPTEQSTAPWAGSRAAASPRKASRTAVFAGLGIALVLGVGAVAFVKSGSQAATAAPSSSPVRAASAQSAATTAAAPEIDEPPALAPPTDTSAPASSTAASAPATSASAPSISPPHPVVAPVPSPQPPSTSSILHRRR
jgi:serine/threonine-protein kinase